MKKDWLFHDEDTVCNFRSVGVLIQNGKILIQREKNGTEYALPGGHVNVNETSEQAIIREYKEETGANISCKRLLWVEESFWKWDEKDAHTIAFYYLVSLSDATAIPDRGDFFSQKDNCGIVLTWLPIEEVKNTNIYPAIIKGKIDNLSETIEHLVSNE